MKIIGHRGAKGLAPENTLASIQKALDYSVDEIEIDARVTSDGHIVLIHDKSLKRLTGDKVKIASHTLLELRRIKPDLTTLNEAIKLIDKRVPVCIEVKPRVPAEPITEVIRSFLSQGWSPEHFAMSSFSYRTLSQLHHQLPNIDTVVLERFSGIRSTWRARRLGTKRITMNRRVIWFGFVRALAKRNYKLATYTLDDPSKASRWAKEGLYAVVTDFPDLYKKS